MDESIVLNSAALVFSLTSIIVAVVVATRQTSMMRHANQLPVLVELTQEFRSEEYQRAEDYVLTELESVETACAVSSLPLESRVFIAKVASFYGTLGVLTVQDIADEMLILSLFGFRARRTFDRLHPFISREREVRGDPYYLSYYEDLACRVDKNWIELRARDSRLNKRSPPERLT